MDKSRTKLLDRVLAVTLAVIMLIAMVPMSTITAFALPFEAGGNCQETNCSGKLQWFDNSKEDGKHYLVCDNDECVRSNIENAYLVHNQGDGDADCLICNPPHAHGGFVYSVENDNKTLVATCGSAGTCNLEGRKVSITIAAPSNLEYDGTVKAATIDGAVEWKTATGNDAPEITYNAEPKAVGSYTASITVSGTTAFVEFSIVKGTPVFTVPTELTAEYGQTLADVALPAGFTWKDETESVGEIGENTFKATFTPSDTDNYNTIDNVLIKVAVGKAHSSIEAPSISGEATQTSITLKEVTPTVGDGAVEYGYVVDEADKDDPSKVTNWQSSTTFTGLEGSKTYYFYARVSETESYTSAVSTVAAIATKEKENGKITLSIASWTYGETAATPEYNIDKGDYSTVKIEYAERGGLNWDTSVPSKAGKYTVRVVCGANAVWAEAIQSYDFEIYQKEVTITWSDTTLIYNSQDQKPSASITSGVINEDDVTVLVSGETTKSAGKHRAEAILSGTDKDNYVIKSNKTQLFTINPKEVTITWPDEKLTHNGNLQPTAVINDREIFAGDVVSVKVDGAQKRPGKYTATASLRGKDASNYVINAHLTSFEFVISNLETPEDPFTIVKASDPGTEAATTNGWYNYDVIIKPKQGYKIATSDENDDTFASEIKITDSKHDYKVFLKEDRIGGGYTGEIPVGNINIDKTAPTVSVKLNEDNIWESFLNIISFDAYDRFFNTTQTVTITAKDESGTNAAGNSGIENVSYYVSNVGMTLDSVKALKDSDWTTGTTVTFNRNNNYVVYTKVVDKAGNITYASSDGFVYDDTSPVINVSFDNNSALNDKYFKNDREITIDITEHNFDAEKVDVTVTAKNADGKDVDIPDYAAYAKDPENWKNNEDNKGEDSYTLRMVFSANANYTFDVKCLDKAGNANNGVDYGTSVAPTEFTIDKTAPNVSLTIEGFADKSWAETWATAKGDGVRTAIDYNGRWSNSAAKVSATSTDDLSGIDYIEYFRTENIVTDITAPGITWSNSTKGLDANRDTFEFEVAPNEKFIVYVHVVDKAGKDIYLSSNGVIVDDKAPGGDQYSPEIDIKLPTANANGIYNKDDTVQVDLKVVEPKYSGAGTQTDTGIYSGIREIKYVIKADDIGAIEENTFNLSDGSKRDSNGLIWSWTGSITIDKAKFNSNNVVVLITAIDNAGNVHTSTTKAGDIKIDITDPEIDVFYDNDSADNAKYFKDDRTATIVVTERNFKEEDVKIAITNTDGVIPTISKWRVTEDKDNPDNTKWTATVTYSADGDYTFDIAYTDLADNACAGARYGNSVAPTEFTVDKTRPVVSVSYNNNDARNDKYFAAPRTATVVVTEHNFDVNRVTFTQTAALNGAAIAIPAASWTHSGDVHTADIVFDRDGDYTFDVSVKDMAGNESAAVNYGNSVAGKDFVIDQTIEKPTIGGIKNGGAYKNEVIPTISLNDVNYDSCEVKLVRTRLGEKNVDVTAEFIKGLSEQAQGASGTFDTFKKLVENDGIYTLTLKMVDKAGNEESEEYTFTVNRFGSVYEYSDALVELIKDGGQYVQSVGSDLVITEYNADKLLAGSLNILVTRDGENVDVDYTSDPAVNEAAGIGQSGWYQYTYTSKAANFAQDGVYKISLTSKYATDDSAENESTSVPNNSIDSQGKEIIDSMNFTVDSVAPEIRNIVNLDKRIADRDKIVDGKLNVKYTVVDVGGLQSIEITVNGKTIQTLTEKEIADNTYNFTGSFDIDEQDSTTAQKVRIKVTDLAGNVTDTDSDDFLKEHSADNENSTYVFFNKVTVSRNFFVRWYANTALFWGSIGGVIVLAAAIWFLVTSKRKKNKEK